MTSPFSARFGFDPRRSREPILDDAPDWLRVGFNNGILNRITYVDGDTRYKNDEQRPLGIKALYESICAHIMVDPEDDYSDSWRCNDVLNAGIRSVAWYHFYDIVEFIGEELQKQTLYDIFGTEPDPRFTFASYRDAVNELFEKANVGYRLNNDCRLVRTLPSALAQRVESTSEQLKDGLESSRAHFRKARRFIFEHPLDPENGIKEIVSCLESVGKKRFTAAKTLGDVVKELRKEDVIPQQLITVIDKFYAFACSEPAVRHGGTEDPKVSLRDAEFCFHVGVALIRYILDRERDV